ncbi:glutamine-hydrolyzing carbamoyl-phosphate synthase small subunit, partial [Paracoccaceae bacterium]|nr:glutamine-hydrolyzing carbamoyl-phosphate synthase small subunit [Paracoccaceae bacterium]
MKKFSGLLLLEDGTTWDAEGFGHQGFGIGELCFNTSMTGYQEILSDPSYAEQIITFTFPHIGNVGTNEDDNESPTPTATGVITKAKPTSPSNWRNEMGLDKWCKKNKLTCLYGIDTRALTQRIREVGAPKGLVHFNKNGNHDLEFLSRMLENWPGIKGRDLTNKINLINEQDKKNDTSRRDASAKIVVFDFGTKANIIHCLEKHKVEVILVSGQATFKEIIELNPDGILLSNGPGDPAATDKFTNQVLKKLVENTSLPIFGICLGHQLLGLALGAKTQKMNHGHHGANHPVLDLATEKVEITSMNHGFAIDNRSLPECIVETHVSLFDRSNCGI